jgi:hypothetical protein
MLQRAVWPLAGALVALASASAFAYEVSLQRVENVLAPGLDPALPDFNDGHYLTYDFIVHVPDNGGGWSSIHIVAQLTGPATFQQHPIGGDEAASAQWLTHFPALEFDCFFAMDDREDLILIDVNNTPNLIDGTWADTPHVPGPKAALAARYTFRLAHQLEDVTLHAEGALTDINWGGMLWDFELELTIPACPGDLNLDRRIDQHDLGLLLSSYQTNADGDVDGDGDTDQDDLALVLGHYDETCQPLP